MKKPALIIGSLLLTVMLLSVVRIYVSNKIATSGVMLDKVQNQLEFYQLQNSLLAEKLYTVSSLTHISEKAIKIGLIEPKNDFVLSGQVPVAFKQ